MNLWPAALYGLTASGLYAIGIWAFFTQPHFMKKILALNIAGSGIFLLFVAITYQGPEAQPDPVPHAMVLTGIVVAVCGTAVSLVLSGLVARSVEGAGAKAPPAAPEETY